MMKINQYLCEGCSNFFLSLNRFVHSCRIECEPFLKTRIQVQEGLIRSELYTQKYKQ